MGDRKSCFLNASHGNIFCSNRMCKIALPGGAIFSLILLRKGAVREMKFLTIGQFRPPFPVGYRKENDDEEKSYPTFWERIV